MRFKEHHHQQAFIAKGYTVVRGLADASLIEKFCQYYRTLPQDDRPFYTSNWVADDQYKRSIHNFLKPHLDELIQRHLTGFKSVFSYYLEKKPSTASKVTIHQDWTLIDEALHPGIILWIPLVDTNEHNGMFHVVPYSHRVFHNIRGTNIDIPYMEYADRIEANLTTPVKASAGDGVFFDHRLLHYSPPNLSKHSRLAAGHVIIPAEATMLHYYHLHQGEEALYCKQVTDDFLLRYSFQQAIPFDGIRIDKKPERIPKNYWQCKWALLYHQFTRANISRDY